MKTIALFSNADGSSKLEAFHFKGKGCKKAIAEYQTKLGTTTAAHDKPEIHQVETVQHLRQGNQS